MKKIIIILFLLSSSYGYSQIGEQVVKYDSFIKKELTDLNLKYTISASGNFNVVYPINDTRTQLVIVNSKTYLLDQIEVREIWSTSDKYSSKSSINEKNIFMLLNKNSTYKFGAWQIGKDTDGPYFFDFSVKVGAKTKGQVLKDIISTVAMRADEMEKELTNKDEH
jgi:hypothetical protein